MNITFTNKSFPLHGYWYPCILLRTQKYQRTPKLTSVMRPGHQELHVGNDTHTLCKMQSQDTPELVLVTRTIHALRFVSSTELKER